MTVRRHVSEVVATVASTSVATVAARWGEKQVTSSMFAYARQRDGGRLSRQSQRGHQTEFRALLLGQHRRVIKPSTP